MAVAVGGSYGLETEGEDGKFLTEGGTGGRRMQSGPTSFSMETGRFRVPLKGQSLKARLWPSRSMGEAGPGRFRLEESCIINQKRNYDIGKTMS